MAGVSDTNIFAVHVSAEGKVLDSQPIAVCNAPGFQAYPSVCFDGKHFLVAWQDYRQGKDWDVYLARVSTDGRVLEPNGVAVASGTGNQIYPAVASAGQQRALVVWSDLQPKTDEPEAYSLSGTLLSEGKPAGPAKVLLPAYHPKTREVKSYLVPQAGYDGTSYVVAAQHHPSGWQYGGPTLIRVNEQLQVSSVRGGFLGESFALACDHQRQRAAIWSFNQYEHGHGRCGYLFSLFLPNQSEQINHHPEGLQEGYGPRNGLWCAVTNTGKHFLVVIEQSARPEQIALLRERGYYAEGITNLAISRVDGETGEFIDLDSVRIPAQVWQDLRHARALRERERKGTRPPITVAAEPGVQVRHPAVASRGDGSALVVYSRRGGVQQFKIYGVLVRE
ncbi:hypothetical protein HRbin36_02195 [bacterium HR36]|nr:hypothetical protein HRbin36_02195 [bacterium HR36]